MPGVNGRSGGGSPVGRFVHPDRAGNAERGADRRRRVIETERQGDKQQRGRERGEGDGRFLQADESGLLAPIRRDAFHGQEGRRDAGKECGREVGPVRRAQT